MASRVFLLTDIESSTRMWAEEPAAMRAALETHDRLVRDAVAFHGGQVFKHTGDGLFASFDSAFAAIMAAAEIQRSLRAQPWEQGAPLRARVGVHAGEAERRGGDWGGPAPNRCARLVGLASGGQTLVSDAARLLVKDIPLGDVRFIDMGERALRGLEAPERVWQIEADDLPAQALAGDAGEPSVTGQSESGNLPVALTTFVGRGAELDEVETLLASHRLVTLTGVGGVGKTRLAVEAAASKMGQYPDGVWFVEMAPTSDRASVLSAVTASLGIIIDGQDGADGVARSVARHLERRRALIVLDNAEQVAGAVASFVHLLLTTCPQLTILVTSRDVLHVTGEATFAVPSLRLPPTEADGLSAAPTSDAVTLFVDRARAARASFALTASNSAAVTQLCRRLDGIPLAIELAAARVRMLDAHQIAERLDDCFKLLIGDSVIGVPERHQTLRAALDWSHDLLDGDEQAALRRLAVFPDRFDIEAAVAVIEDTAGAPPGKATGGGFMLLAQLVDKSLVVVGGGDDTRYRLLEPIRQYAAERLAAAGETDVARDRHRDVYLARSDDQWPLLSGKQRAARYEDRENLRAALEWSWGSGDVAAALRLVVAAFMSWAGMDQGQGREWLERLVGASASVVHPARLRALNLLALTLHDAGQPGTAARAEELYAQAKALADQIDDAIVKAECQLVFAEYELSCGRSDAGRPASEAALRAYEQLAVLAGIGWCHHHLGWVAVAEHDYQQARTHFEHAVDIAHHGDQAGCDWLLPHALAALAPVSVLVGDPQRGLRSADEAVTAARHFASPAVLLMALARATEAALLADSNERAEHTLHELLRLLHKAGTRRWAAHALEMGGVLLEQRGDHRGALSAFDASRALRATTGGNGGGIDAVAPVIQRSYERLQKALPLDQMAAYEQRLPSLSTEQAVVDMVTALGTSHSG